MLAVNAASLVAAGMLSVLLLPGMGLCRLRVAGLAVAITDDDASDERADRPEGSESSSS